MMVADALIQAKNWQYGFDSRPAFQDWPVEQGRAGKFANMEKIAMELHAGKDGLVDRPAAQRDGFLPRLAEAVAPAFRL